MTHRPRGSLLPFHRPMRNALGPSVSAGVVGLWDDRFSAHGALDLIHDVGHNGAVPAAELAGHVNRNGHATSVPHAVHEALRSRSGSLCFARVRQEGVGPGSARQPTAPVDGYGEEVDDTTWVLGLDSCPGGWAGIGWSGEQVIGVFGHDVATVVEEFAGHASSMECIGIDIPIGLPDTGQRRADSLARARLVGKASTVFTTPTRLALKESDYQRALATQRRLAGVGLSKQAYALRDKIFDVDRWLPCAPCLVVEVHPEVSFAAIQGSPVAASKKTWAGFRERMRLLESVGLVVPSDLGELGARAGSDDVLDAAAAAWTAMRVVRGEAESLPDPPERFSDGWPAAIWV